MLISCFVLFKNFPAMNIIHWKHEEINVYSFLSAQNLKRVAETWMDEFAEYIYQRRPEYRHLSTGDISAQKELRRHLKCKDFKWFMAAVAWDVPKYYPPVEPPPAAWGEVRNGSNLNESNILDCGKLKLLNQSKPDSSVIEEVHSGWNNPWIVH